ncbi:glycosyltransferase family 25 protein [Aureimonas pseudogalii]|uniref:Glycosyl transferase family 25 n=1 Tax=Aureimonas pseudogalii TaxID=1744844 RepID=A0A7W6EDQ5_9HYPH|nr:glycosyltransferase family 25 protein [Aureimonas pseudogalii]MBB3996328.1 glycosyl transferase family 25 [Aureimonas pseudogalii]
MRIGVINLDRAAERWTFMADQGARLGLAFERVRAVQAGEIAEATARRLNGRWERSLSPAELGCFLSHHGLWREIAVGTAPVCVLEDDAVLSRRLAEALPMLAAFTEAEFLNLESFDRRRFVARTARPLGEGLSVRRVFRDKSGSAAYLLWPAGARKLLRRAERGAAPVDAFLHGLAGLNAWQAEPALAIQAHLWARRGHGTAIDPGTSIQAPRERLPLTPENAHFHRRRIATQLRLAGHHLRRLGPAVYRRTELDERDFP